MKIKFVISKNNAPWWLCLMLSVMIAVNMIPNFSRNASLILQFAVLILVPVSIYKRYFALKHWEKNTIYLILFYIAIEAFYKITEISDATVDFYFSTIKFFWLYIVYRPLRERLGRGQKIYLILITLVCFLYTVYTNIVYSKTYDHYISMFLREADSNAANTAYSSATMLLCGLFTIIAIKTKSLQNKILCIGLTAVGFYYLIFVAERGTTFILSILMLLLIFLYRKGKKNKRTIIIFFAGMIFSLIYFSGILTVFLIWMQGILPDRLAARMGAIINLVEGSSIAVAGSTMTTRYVLFQTSISTFFGSAKVFLMGAGDIRSSNRIIGNHSQWIDVFARYGVFGGALLLYNMKRIFMVTRNDYPKVSYKYREYSVLFIIFLIRGLLGNVFAPVIGTVLFITIPCALSLLDEEQPEIIEEHQE